MASDSTTRKTPTQEIFERIRTELDNGTVPWHKPWVVNSTGIVSHRGRSYSLRNRMLLMYPGEYLTYQQVLRDGGHVKKGEHGQRVYLSRRITVKNKDTGEDEDKYLLRGWTVFRTEQCKGITSNFEHLWKYGGEPKEDVEAMWIVNDYCERCGVNRINGGNKAFYCPEDHTIVVPGYQAYTERELYWNTMFHELGHSTARFLNRKQGGSFGSSQYAREELVAEICAALCLGKLGMDTTRVIQQSGAYLRSWQSKISNLKPNEFGEACHLAEQAFNLIFNLTTNKEAEIG